MMRWSVGLVVEGDRVMLREEIVELADAVAASSGMASGIGTMGYGAQLLVFANGRDEAIAKATDEFLQAAARAGLPEWPIVRVEAENEEDALANEVD